MHARHSVLCLVGFYLPGYKAGGPLRTISNMVECLGDEFDFWVITRDRDLGDLLSYPNVDVNQWVKVGKARVFYASHDHLTLYSLARLINKTPHDVLYLNSFFDSTFTLKPLLARSLGMLKTQSVVLAPRGEFSEGALKLKPFRKRVYIALFKLFSLCQISWQASSDHERQDIKQVLHIKSNIISVALDLPAKTFCQISLESKLLSEEVGNNIKLIFLSRISPMKNLDYVLKVLSEVHVDALFDIYGPQEDPEYWGICEALIEKLPGNITCNYRGICHPNEVAQTFSKYDLFVFPTRGENYGHVIAESLSVGTPVLLSDKTPWRNLKIDGLGLDVPLEDAEEFVHYIEKIAHSSAESRNEIRERIKKKAFKRLMNPEVIDANRNLFLTAINWGHK